jgi:hypothetical protein
MEARGYFEWPPRGEGFWYQEGVSTEQLKQDYGECRGKNHGWPCMEAKGYAWNYNGSGYWYKAGVDLEQLKHDYGECKAKGEVTLCIEENGYIRVPFSSKKKGSIQFIGLVKKEVLVASYETFKEDYTHGYYIKA